MRQNYSVSGDKLPTGQSLSRFIDAIMSDFGHILWTRALSAQNVLESACGGWHHGPHSACFELKVRSRRDLNLIVNRP